MDDIDINICGLEPSTKSLVRTEEPKRNNKQSKPSPRVADSLQPKKVLNDRKSATAKSPINKDKTLMEESPVEKMKVANDSDSDGDRPSSPTNEESEEAPISHTRKGLRKSKQKSDRSYHASVGELSRGSLKDALPSTQSTRIFTNLSVDSLNLHPRISTHLKKSEEEKGMGINQFTRVQMMAIPQIIAGQQVVIKSETGSGKTLAYLLPIVHNLLSMNVPIDRSMGTFAIILAPTRELCTQILDVSDN